MNATKQTQTKQTEACSRCAGEGSINAYRSIMGGVCFKCGGSGLQIARKARPKKQHVDTRTERSIEDILSGSPFSDKARAAQHAKEIGVTRMDYRVLTTLWNRGQKTISIEKFSKMRARFNG